MGSALQVYKCDEDRAEVDNSKCIHKNKQLFLSWARASVMPFLPADTTASWPLGRRFAWICWGGGGSGGGGCRAGGDGGGGTGAGRRCGGVRQGICHTGLGAGDIPCLFGTKLPNLLVEVPLASAGWDSRLGCILPSVV